MSPSARRRRATAGLSLTTPAQLRLVAAVLVVGLAVLGAVGVRAAVDRSAAVTSVADEAAPLLVNAEKLYVALAEADAAASSAFLRAGFEPSELRIRYRAALATASALLTQIAAEPDLSPTSTAALTRIAEGLPVYNGDVEAARVNNRMRFPVGAAHLRRASDAMVQTLLPAASGIHRRGRPAVRRLRRRHFTCSPSGAGRGRCRRLGPPGGDAGAGGVADEAAPERGTPRGDGAGRSARRVDAGRDRRAGIGAGPVAARGLGPAHRPVDGPDPGAAIDERREPRPHRARHAELVPGGLRRGRSDRRRGRRCRWTARHGGQPGRADRLEAPGRPHPRAVGPLPGGARAGP